MASPAIKQRATADCKKQNEKQNGRCIRAGAAAMFAAMKLALSILCEHPTRKTGLTTLFHEFIRQSLLLYPDVDWIIYAGAQQDWTVNGPRVDVVRDFAGNDRLAARLLADHFLVPADARRRGASALLTTGFVPARRCLPSIFQLYSLHHLHAENQLDWARKFYRTQAVRRGLRRATLIITNSHFAEKQILAVDPACAGRLIVSYEGLDHAQFQPQAAPDEAERLRAKFDLDPGYLLWVSNFYAYKQADKLLAAYARLDPALRARHPLAMVGGGWAGGADAAAAFTRSLGIEKDVRFLGWIDDEWLAPLYRQARAFVLASREETFGKCVAEAMACGTPSVVNHIPIMNEVTGGHAFIADFDDPSVAAEALRSLCQDDALHARLRRDGMAWAQQFRFDALCRERIDAIRHALQSPAAQR
jgi:glycosyltransferase involved in cell wall biosynthesis